MSVAVKLRSCMIIGVHTDRDAMHSDTAEYDRISSATVLVCCASRLAHRCRSTPHRLAPASHPKPISQRANGDAAHQETEGRREATKGEAYAATPTTNARQRSSHTGHQGGLRSVRGRGGNAVGPTSNANEREGGMHRGTDAVRSEIRSSEWRESRA